MRIMTIHAAHFGFPNRVMVRQIGLGTLLLVAPQAVLIHDSARFDGSLLAARIGMNRVAVDALNVLCLVCARKPVANMIGFRMAI